MLNLKGKNVIVTGGSRGIGSAVVKLFSELGANVAFNYNKNYRAAEELAEASSGSGGKIIFFECDVSNYPEVESFVRKVKDQFNTIDILINNAGIWEYNKIHEMPVDAWRRTMQINLDGVFYFSHTIIRHMKENNIRGNLVNVSSTAGQRGEANYSHYAATKGGIISFTKSLASELGPDGIRINCVAPGWVKTDMTTEALAKEGNQILSQIPLGFIPDPADIAGPIVFLASDLAGAITGEILNVNCGSVLCG